jgi:hypothetical protein
MFAFLGMWYVEGDMQIVSAVLLSGFVLLFAAARGAYRFKVGPLWLRRLIFDRSFVV